MRSIYGSISPATFIASKVFGKWNVLQTIGLLLLIGSSSLKAQELESSTNSDRVQFHGYGNWSAGYTNENHYLDFAEPEGNWDRISSVLVIHANPFENLEINTSTEFTVMGEDLDVRLNFAFVVWTFSDAFKLRLGQPKHPFSLYSEIFQVGTLRPFVMLPTSVYGPGGVIGEFYRGVGVTGSLYTDSDWTFSYDLYFGDIDIPEFKNWVVLEETPDSEEEEWSEDTVNTIGARITMEPPVGGLLIGISGFTGEIPEEDARRICLSGYIEYLWKSLTLRGEYTHLTEIADADGEVEETMNSFYLEASYKPTEWLQLAAMYGFSSLEEELEAGAEEIESSLRDHQEVAVGINYIFNTSFILKLSYHFIIGNRYAHPTLDRLEQVIEADELDDHTHALFFGTAFGF